MMQEVMGYVDEQTYFIEAMDDSHLVKIGKSRMPDQRLTQFQLGSPVQLRLLGILDGDHEKELHGRFFEFHRHGEWFYAAPTNHLGRWLAKCFGDGATVEGLQQEIDELRGRIAAMEHKQGRYKVAM